MKVLVRLEQKFWQIDTGQALEEAGTFPGVPVPKASRSSATRNQRQDEAEPWFFRPGSLLPFVVLFLISDSRLQDLDDQHQT